MKKMGVPHGVICLSFAKYDTRYYTYTSKYMFKSMQIYVRYTLVSYSYAR